MPNENDINIRSEKVEQLLAHLPSWIVRWGTASIFILLLALVAMSWFIHYPSVITGKTRLVQAVAPVKLSLPISGVLQGYFVENGDLVKAGDSILKIKSNLTRERYLVLRQDLQEIEQALDDKSQAFPPLSYAQDANEMGLPASLSQLQVHLSKYQELLSIPYFKRKTANLSAQIKQCWKLSRIIDRQLVQAKRGNLSLDSLEKERAKNQLLILQTENKVAEIESEWNKRKAARLLVIQASLDSIYSYLDSWQETYILTSTSDGLLEFLGNFELNAGLNAHVNLVTIKPVEQRYEGYIWLPAEEAAQVKPGQKVQIVIDNYPASKFGKLAGVISEISDNPVQHTSGTNVYLAKIGLNNGLQTNFDQKIAFFPEMEGHTRILTEDLRLFERVFSNLRKGF